MDLLGPKFSILVAESEITLRDIIIDDLKKGLVHSNIIPAEDGNKAITKLNNQFFNLVIADLELQKMDGLELVRQINKLKKEFKPTYILLIGSKIEQDDLKYKENSISKLKRPFNTETLVNYIKALQDPDSRPKANNTKMNVEFINPFVSSTLDVLKITCGIEALKDSLFVKNKDQHFGDITGLITISSKNLMGSMAIIFPENVYLHIISNMLGETYTEINEENRDGVAEICNQVYGNAKALLNAKNIFLDMTIPTVVTGKNHTINHTVANTPVIVIKFKTAVGDFYIETVVIEK